MLKVPALIAHYFEHNQENSELCFWDFISEHYNHEHDTADKRHAELPFKSFQNHLNHCHWIDTVYFRWNDRFNFHAGIEHGNSIEFSALSSAYTKPLIHPPAEI